MSDYNNKFDVDTQGLRSRWAEIKHLYDSTGRPPNDSESIGHQMYDYIAAFCNDVNNATVAGLRSFDSELYRDSDGYGGESWDLTDSYNPRVIDAYTKTLNFISGKTTDRFYTTGTARNKNNFNVVALDSDGKLTTTNIFTLLKLNLDDWLAFDFFARKDVARRTLTAIEEDSDLQATIKQITFKNIGDDSDTASFRVPANVWIGTTPPTTAQPKDLWFNDSEDVARLFVYYQDSDSLQWIETSPALDAPSFSSIDCSTVPGTDDF